MMNEAMRVLMTRRSVRKFESRQVDEETLSQILEAGLYAPSAMGLQSALLVVVRDPVAIARLSRMNAQVMCASGDPFYGAPTVIVVLSDLDKARCPVEDGALAMGNLMNAAWALGVSSCWINRAREVFDTDEGKEMLRAWGLTGHYRGIGNCVLGYADGDAPAAKPRADGRVLRV